MEPIGDPLIIVVSRQEVEACDIDMPLATLNKLLTDPEHARDYIEGVDLSIDGYNDDPRELYEIEDVRSYIQQLDLEFPYWLFFMSKYYLGLQFIVLCFLPPFLTKVAEGREHRKRLQQFLEKRWLPALEHVSAFAGLTETEVDALLSRFLTYMTHGQFDPREDN